MYALLREKENKGEIVDWTTSVELPDETFVLNTDKFTDSGFEIGNFITEHTTKGLFEPDAIGVNVDYLKPLRGDFNGDDIFSNKNLSHMNELMGDIGYEHDYPETPYGELCEFLSSLETSESESDKKH